MMTNVNLIWTCKVYVFSLQVLSGQELVESVIRNEFASMDEKMEL
jgi:hypothetical protein